MNDINLSQRLLSAVGFVRKDAVFADIGTDHGYLPIYLYKKGLIKNAVAADINRLPLASAEKNIALYKARQGVSAVLSDGLEKLEPYHPTDIAIFGMGGELICNIISRAEWVKNSNIRLILQPMTKQDDVRSFLLENGFEIIDEALSLDEGKIYQTICAEYCGISESYTQAHLILGKKNIERGGSLFAQFLESRTEVYKKRLEGKRLAGLGREEELLLSEFNKIKEVLV